MTTTVDVAGAIDPDRLAELEAERSFLLQSLRDLDAEWSAGDVDQHDYVTLRDGYTKRAADVMRQIDDGRSRLPARRVTPWRRGLAVIAAVLAVAGGAGWLVARSSGQRLPGQEISGGGPGLDVAGMLTQARQLLASDPAQSIELYTQVIEERPGHAEAYAYRGWLLFVTTGAASEDLRAQAIGLARDDLDAAIAADPQYADPHCFLAVIAANYDADDSTARTESARCLALDPPAEVQTLMEQFVSGLAAPATTSP